MKTREKKEAVALRKTGLTYKEIIDKLPVSKSSLSYWLRSIELTNEKHSIFKTANNESRKSRQFSSKRYLSCENFGHKAAYKNQGLG